VSELTDEPLTDEPGNGATAQPSEALQPTGEHQVGSELQPTGELELSRDPLVPAALETAQLEIHPDDPDDEWSSTQTRSGLRLGVPTAILLALVVLAGGFWGGAVAEKHHASGSSSSSALSALATRFAAARGAAGGSGASGLGGATGFSGASGFAGASSAASGIVTAVEGNILYVTTSTGSLVKVEVGPSVPVTRTAKSSLGGLQTGDTVVVQGTKASNGNVTATSVRATGQGVTTGTGAGGGGGGLSSFLGGGGGSGTGGTGGGSGGGGGG